MIAEFTKYGHRYGLIAEKPDSFYKDYRIVFSLYNGGSRSFCTNMCCDMCPFDSPDFSCLWTTYDHNYLLRMFGITQESHPEYFI